MTSAKKFGRLFLKRLQHICKPIVKYLVDDIGAETFDDFRCMYTAATNWNTEIIAKVKVEGEAIKQAGKWASRLKQVWEAIVQAHDEHRAVLIKGPGALKMDDLLDEPQLADMREVFWARYKIKYPSDITPGDALVSRKYKELSNFLLSVGNPLKARSIAFDRTHDPAKVEIAVGLTFDPHKKDVEVSRPGGVDNWLGGLWFELLALAIAGCKPIEPQPEKPETRASDPSDYVTVPLCVVLRYLWRAKRAAERVPTGARYGWLKQLCTAERTIWQERQREQRRPLGKIILDVYKERDQCWWQTLPPLAAAPSGDNKWLSDQVKTLQNTVKQLKGKGKGDKGGGVVNTTLKPPRGSGDACVEATLKNGDALCQDFQWGKCRSTGKGCPKGLHKCAGILPGSEQRICGLANHGAQECRRAKRVS